MADLDLDIGNPEWLMSVLRGDLHLIGGNPTEDLIERILTVHASLEPKQRLKLDQSLVSVLARCSPDEAHGNIMFSVLRLVSAAKPFGAESVLEKRLRSRELLVAQGDEFPLEAQAILAVAEYQIYDWLVEFLTDRCQEDAGGHTLMAALRVLSLRSSASLSAALVALSKSTTMGESDSAMERALFSTIVRAGSHRVFRDLVDAQVFFDLRNANTKRLLKVLRHVLGKLDRRSSYFYPLLVVVELLRGISIGEAVRSLCESDAVDTRAFIRTIDTVNALATRYGQPVSLTVQANQSYAGEKAFLLQVVDGNAADPGGSVELISLPQRLDVVEQGPAMSTREEDIVASALLEELQERAGLGPPKPGRLLS